METTVHAEYLSPGAFFPEESSKRLDAYDPDEALRKAPSDAYCFVLYRLAVPSVDLGPRFRIVSVRQDVSKRYYIGGKLFTVEEIEQLPGDNHLLASNISSYGGMGILCRTGNWQPFNEGDMLLTD
jgi:hypothetical protein